MKCHNWIVNTTTSKDDFECDDNVKDEKGPVHVNVRLDEIETGRILNKVSVYFLLLDLNFEIISAFTTPEIQVFGQHNGHGDEDDHARTVEVEFDKTLNSNLAKLVKNETAQF